ncbi:Methicillin resistance mecR1 protein [compost metagenome]
MGEFLEILVSLSTAGSTVVACILLLQLIPDRAVSAKWRYLIGKMALGFYLVPVVLFLQWFWSTLNYEHKATIFLSKLSTVTAVPEFNLSEEVTLILISIWATGTFIFALWQVYGYRRFINKLQDTCLPVHENCIAYEQLATMKVSLGIKTTVRLEYSPFVQSPVLVGLWKPTIYLPSLNTTNIDMVILHELIHLKQKDLWFKALGLAASSLHWFNPFVHILRKYIHTWSEFSCDEVIVSKMSYTERKRYAETVFNVAIESGNVPIRFCASLSGNGRQLKRRLSMMLNVKKFKKRSLISTMFTILLIGLISVSSAVWASKNVPHAEVDTTLTNVTNSVTVKSEGVIERRLNEHQHEKKQLKP